MTKLVVKNLFKYDDNTLNFVRLLDGLLIPECGEFDERGLLNDEHWAEDRLDFIFHIFDMYINGSETYVRCNENEWEGDNWDVDIMKSLGWITQVDENTLELDF